MGREPSDHALRGCNCRRRGHVLFYFILNKSGIFLVNVADSDGFLPQGEG